MIEIFNEERLAWIFWSSSFVQIACAVGLIFYEGPQMRKYASTILVVILVFIDTLLVNFPKSTEPIIYANEVMNCTANLAIGGGLLMILGLRD